MWYRIYACEIDLIVNFHFYLRVIGACNKNANVLFGVF